MRTACVILNIAIILAILLTPHTFYNGFPFFVDYLILFLAVINLITSLLKISQTARLLGLTITFLSLFYVLTTAYLYQDGDFDYKNYRLIYLHIHLNDFMINLFQDLSTYILIPIVLLEFCFGYFFYKSMKHNAILR